MQVFSRPRFVFLAIILALFIFLTLSWLSVQAILFTILSESQEAFGAKISMASNLMWSSLFDFSTPDRWYALLLATLVGANTSMLLFYYHAYRIAPSKAWLTGFLGASVGILGFGCAACGSLLANIVLTNLIGVWLGTSFNGIEFQILGIALLLFSIYKLARAINDPALCEI